MRNVMSFSEAMIDDNIAASAISDGGWRGKDLDTTNISYPLLISKHRLTYPITVPSSSP